jgi:hypothetical protein
MLYLLPVLQRATDAAANGDANSTDQLSNGAVTRWHL